MALLLVVAACSTSRRVPPVTVPASGAVLPSTAAPRPIGPTPAHVGPLDARVSTNDLDALWERQLMVPVEGIPRSLAELQKFEG